MYNLAGWPQGQALPFHLVSSWCCLGVSYCLKVSPHHACFSTIPWKASTLSTLTDTGAVLSADGKPIHRLGEHFFTFLKLYSGWGGKGKLVGSTKAVRGSKTGVLTVAVLGSTPVCKAQSPAMFPLDLGRSPSNIGCLLHWIMTSGRALKPHHCVVWEILATVRCWDLEIPN